jgi:hypothetical protein
MSHAILSAQIVAAWREATHPLSKERALEIANEILTDHPSAPNSRSGLRSTERLP